MNNDSYNTYFNNRDNNSNNNNNNNNPLNNKNHAKHVNNTRNTVFILGDNTVKNVNGYFLTKKLQNKKLIEVRLFSGAKVNCMYDHVKPTIRDLNLNHITLHVGINELGSSKKLES